MPEMKVTSPQVGNTATPPRRRGRPQKDKADPTGETSGQNAKRKPISLLNRSGNNRLKKRLRKPLWDRSRQFCSRSPSRIKRVLRDKQSKSGCQWRWTTLSLVSKEFIVHRLAGELFPSQQLIPTPSALEPKKGKPGSGSTSNAAPPEGSPVDLRAVRTCYVLLMIPVQIGDVIFPRVLVDTGSGVNVMSNQIRIRLGYHRMAPPTTKLAMADNTLVWPLGMLLAVSVVVEGVRLIVSFQVIEMKDLEWTQLILGRTWQKGTRAIINMDDEVMHIRVGTNLTMVK
ncbi:hypothetical protein R1flu_008559 [Riccia fluitans]|uniref:Uncharacterized protein n=1 Tax=Riccia fluitans TaxID=41844 RepID=A0ABD1YC14_9MARC